MPIVETRTVPGESLGRTTRNESIPRWSRRARLFLGLVTFVLIFVFAFAAIASMLAAEPGATLDSIDRQPFQVLLVLAIFMQFLLLLFYISFASQNPRLPARGAWMFAMVFMPWAILPVYWYLHIWRAPYVGSPRRDYNVPGGQLTPQAD